MNSQENALPRDGGTGMPDVAVRVSGVSKIYSLGQQNVQRRFTDVLAGILLPRFLRADRDRRSAEAALDRENWIYALNGIDLKIMRGEVVGIIGPNGAGKSTLLKILTRITPPTAGRIDIHGRVGALLEVGSGFHPELTGRENVLLNGMMIGMTRATVRERMDEIVSFAQVEKFIDTPVKWYSSGMFMRLAFSVAAHLDAEIMLVDEVLAVGDIGFQQKCLQRIRQIASDGRTVLFVSHNMDSIRRFCDWVAVIQDGAVTWSGDVESCIRYYEEVCRDQYDEEGPAEL